MNRKQLQQLAEDRILDAAALLTMGRFSGAYYLAGYALECGLKSCILAYVEISGAIFLDRKYSEKCWTHSLGDLLALAGLEKEFGQATAVNLKLENNWDTASIWTEGSRYQQKSQLEAQKLYDAIETPTDGVLPWIWLRW